MAEELKTNDLVLIEKWAKKRKGVPSKVQNTDDLLRIKFDNLEEGLVEITWAEFFEVFTKKKLYMVYSDDEDSRFYKFVN